MKLMKVFSALLLLSALFIAVETNAQAKIESDDYVVVFTDDYGVTFESILAHKTVSASGHIKISASFKLPEEHYLVPPKGWWPTIVRFIVCLDNGNGDEIQITDEKVDIPHNGKFNVSLHLNGSGKNLPWGWYIPEYE